MKEIVVTEKEIKEIIDEEWKGCERVLSNFAVFKGISLESLKEMKCLIKPSPELVVWNCKGLWDDGIHIADEEGVLKILSAKIAGRIMEKVCKGMV